MLHNIKSILYLYGMANITIEELYNRFKKFDGMKEGEITVKKNASLAILLNQQQLTSGRNLANSKIAPNYASERYEIYKNHLNQSLIYLWHSLVMRNGWLFSLRI